MRIPPLAIALLLLSSVPASADRIDGDWCDGTGRHLRIAGPTIEIPSGAVMQGDYDRHGFRYVGPPGDPEEGVEVLMRLHSEEEMELVRRTGGAFGAPETWRRCQATS